MVEDGSTSRVGPAAPIRVLIVDDQQLLRRGLRLLLETVPGITVAGEAADGREGLAVIRQADVDVVLTDARMPIMDGPQLVAFCAVEHPGLPVIMLTTFDDDTLVRDALRAGAAGFLLKDSSPEQLADAIRAVACGGLAIDPRVARAAFAPPHPEQHCEGERMGAARGLEGRGSDSRTSDPLALLTRAERLVAEQVVTGATNDEIAAALVLATGTVKNHVSALLRKLSVRDRTALALMLRDLLPR